VPISLKARKRLIQNQLFDQGVRGILQSTQRKEQSGTSALNKAGRSSLEAFIGREEVSEAVLKWFEDEGRAKELGTVKALPGAAEHQRAFLILIREVQR
jgi:hypothetical protein